MQKSEKPSGIFWLTENVLTVDFLVGIAFDLAHQKTYYPAKKENCRYEYPVFRCHVEIHNFTINRSMVKNSSKKPEPTYWGAEN